MAYRIERPGTLHVYAEGRDAAIAVLALFGVVTAGSVGWNVLTTGWQNEMLAALGVLAFLAVMGRFVFRHDRHEIGPQGIRTLGRDAVARPDVRVDRVRVDVSLRRPSGDGRGAARVDYEVELVLDEAGRRDTLLVLSAPTEAVAREAAEEIAREMGWPFEDAVGDEPELREPDEIDRRAERKPEPTGEVPSGIRVLRHARGESLELEGLISPAQARLLPILGVGVASTTVLAAGFVWHWMEPTMAMVGIALMGLGDAVFLGILFGLRASRERVVVSSGLVERRVQAGPLRLPGRALDLRRVERVRIQTRIPLLRGCVLVSNDDTMRLGRGLDREGLRWLQGWLQSRLP